MIELFGFSLHPYAGSWLLCTLLAVWLVFIAVHDLRTWTVPAWSTWPAICAAAVWQAWFGRWAPLALFALLFLWDTDRADLERILRRAASDGDDRPLLPDSLVWAGQAVILAVAVQQGSPALSYAAGMAVVHTLWRLGRLPGGDAALLMALFGVFPDPRFFAVSALVIAGLTLPRLAWKYAPDLLAAGQLALAAGPAAAVGVLGAAVQKKAKVEPVAYVFSAAGLLALITL